MNYNTTITDNIRSSSYGNRSYVRPIHAMIVEQGLEDKVAESMIDTLAFTLDNQVPLTAVCRKMANRVYRIVGMEGDKPANETIRIGGDILNWAASSKLVWPKMRQVLTKKGLKEQYHLDFDQDFQEFLKHRLPELRLDNGVTPWVSPVLTVGDTKLDIVKSARRHNLLSDYRYSSMPLVYRALNRLNSTEWLINREMLQILQQGTVRASLVPSKINSREYEKVIKHLSAQDRVAKFVYEQRFEQLVNEGTDVEVAGEKAAKSALRYLDKKADENPDEVKANKEIISKWSKRYDFDRCMAIAEFYQDSTLNFIYNCDSRGRVYALQQRLNPQGSDFAKSLLMFANPKPISNYDFCITLANHAGQDKESYDDRIAWVAKHTDAILAVGSDPWSTESMNWMVANKIDREKKSKFQFIAACVEFKRYTDHILAGLPEEEFLCRIPVAYDATNSGLQILSALARDETIAPLVNITQTPKPGDVYQYVGNYLANDCPVESLKVYPAGHKVWRKICKRNVMTKCYAATRIGMGDQHKEDHSEYGTPETDKLTVKECRDLGAKVFDLCIEALPAASKLMKKIQNSVADTDETTVKWRLPSGFLAFQHKELEDKEGKQVKITLGEDTIQLRYYIPTDKPHRGKHQLAMAPDLVHSLDAWLLIEIVNEMPIDSNLAFVHDQFGSDSWHGGDLQDVAKICYKLITSRTVLADLLEQIAKKPVELDPAGSWDPSELDGADYLVC